MNETKAWEVDTMRGHVNNVSCVLFHPKHELILSNSEDRTIRVWDISKRTGVQTFRRESDRFWILAAHSEQNLLAAGHDSGMIVFKLERERPAFDIFSGKCFYVKDRFLRVHEFSSGRDAPLVSLRRTSSSSTPGIGGGPRTLNFNSFNKAENNVIITSDIEGGTYELLTFSLDSSGSGDAQDIRRGNGLAAVFLARDRFAVLDKSRQILVKNFQNDVVKKITSPLAGIDGLFYAGTSGWILLRSEDRVMLYDQQARKVLSELQVAKVKYVVWNKDFSMIALISKHQLVLANKQLELLCSVSETVRLKGGCWDSQHTIFFYTTLNHIKYVVPNGDKGILRGLDNPVYLTKFHGQSLFCLDREGKMKTIEVDVTEAVFKLALDRKDYSEVLRMVKNSRLCGQAIISYLQEKKYPEVALHFVHDVKVKFKLALACGNIQVAMNCAQELGDEAWTQLGVEALRQGNHEVVEMAYQKTKEFEKLSFLYLITGNTEKLKKMQKISEMRGDVMSRFHNALLLGDVEERVKVLESTGQLALAHLTAKTHGLDEHAARIEALLEAANMPIPAPRERPTLLQPPTPICRGENWPLLALGKSAITELQSRAAAGEKRGGVAAASSVSMGDDGDEDEAPNKWGDDDLFDDEDGDGDDGMKSKLASQSGDGAQERGKGWGDDDLDLSDDEPASKSDPLAALGGSLFSAPQAGNPPTVSWCAESSHCADHIAAASVESALQLLNRQIAATSVASMKPFAVSIALGAAAYLPGIPMVPANRTYLLRGEPSSSGSRGVAAKSLPALSMTVPPLLEKLKAAYRLFTAAQFAECKANLDSIMSSIPLVLAASKADSNDVRELCEISREYITAIRIKSGMTEGEDANVSRQLELAAYFTHCNLQPAHLMLALKTAMASAFKNKNFINAASFARRLLELPEMNSERNVDSRSKAQKVLQKSEKECRNEHTIDYDEMNPFNIDCSALKPIYKGSPSVKCPYCQSVYAPIYKGKVCATCNISTVGMETVGLVTQSGRSK